VIIRKSPAEIDAIAASGAILVRTLRLLESQIRPGVTTAELDAAAERYIRSQGAVPTFKGYRGFPGSICASPNSMIVHGIPGPYALERGDVISLDVGVTLDGWVSDAARTFAVGPPPVLAQNLLEGTERSLMAAVEQCVLGNRLGDVSHAVQASAKPTAWRSCARWSATASGATCTRIRRSRTSATPAPARAWRRGWCWRSSR
jgi:methionyl aminopeptidase